MILILMGESQLAIQSRGWEWMMQEVGAAVMVDQVVMVIVML